MSYNTIRVGGVKPTNSGDLSTTSSNKVYSYKVNGTYNSGSFSYSSPLHLPFYNGINSSYYTVVSTSGFVGLQDSPDIVVARSGTNTAYWWDLLTIPAGRWIVRVSYADHQSTNVNGYIQVQTSTGTALGPRCHYSATSAGCGVAIGFIDSASPTTIRTEFVGSGSFYRAFNISHLYSSIQVSKV